MLIQRSYGRWKTGGGGWWWSWEGDSVESCALLPLQLLWTFTGLIWFTCVFVPPCWEVSNPTSPLSLLPSSIRSASVRKCLRTFHGAERQRRASSLRGAQPRHCSLLTISEIFIRLLKSLLCEPLGSRGLHKFAPRNASGAHRWVRTARCQRSHPRAPNSPSAAPQLDPPNLPSWVREQPVGFACKPAVAPCLIQGEMDLYAQ